MQFGSWDSITSWADGHTVKS